MSTHMSRVYPYQAHRADWPEPGRRRHWQYALAVAGYTALILGVIAGILALGGIAGAVLGLDMG